MNNGITSINKAKLINLFQNPTNILLVIFLGVLIAGGIFVPTTFQIMNITNVLRLVSIVGIVAIGEALVMITGEIDISVGSIISLSLVTGGLFINQGTTITLIITLLTGFMAGLINGFAIGKGKVNSLIMTLGTFSVFGGLANVVSRGQAIYLYNSPSYLWLGKGSIFNIPFPVFVFFGILIFSFVFLELTRIGKYFYYTGSNPIASWYSGIRVDNIKTLAFGLSGLFASVAGPLFSSQTNRITSIQGTGFELSAIAIAVLGGTALEGGRGNIIGVFVGALTYQFLLNILSLSGVGTYMEQVLKGVLLITIVILFQLVKKRY